MNDFEIRIIKYNDSHKNSTVLRDIKTALETVFGEQYAVIHNVDANRLAINIPCNLPEGADEVVHDGDGDES